LAAAKADTKRRFGLKKVEVFEPKPPAPPKPVFETGQEVRIMTEDYGKSYKGRKGTVADVTEDVIMVTVPRRKTPMSINPNHLESV
jgi:transcription antitermination factor NusG